MTKVEIGWYLHPMIAAQSYPESNLIPWPHQLDAWNRYGNSNRAYLAHDMGTGKTKTAIDLLNGWGVRRVLILCPLAVASVWPAEFKKHSPVTWHVPHFKVSWSTKKKALLVRRYLDRLAVVPDAHVAVVLNYESSWRPPFGPDYDKKNKLIDNGLLLDTTWDAIVLDEAHRIKSPGSNVSFFCKDLRMVSRRRLLLSGTPMPHSPLDIYAQFRFLDNRIFGNSYQIFRQRYALVDNLDHVVDFMNLDELQEKFFCLASVIRKRDVLNLPPVSVQNIVCDLSPQAMKVYVEMDKLFVAEVEAGRITAANGLVKLLRLQQITGGTVRLEDGSENLIDNSKMKVLASLLDDLPPAEPVVVFARFTADLKAIHAAAEKTGRTSLELSGQRKELDQWQAGEGTVLAVQIQAGGLGVDLTRACYAFYYSVGFSLGDYEQSLARLDRYGQTRPVTYYHLQARGTIDARVLYALRQKKEVVESILSQIVEKQQPQEEEMEDGDF